MRVLACWWVPLVVRVSHKTRTCSSKVGVVFPVVFPLRIDPPPPQINFMGYRATPDSPLSRHPTSTITSRTRAARTWGISTHRGLGRFLAGKNGILRVHRGHAIILVAPKLGVQCGLGGLQATKSKTKESLGLTSGRKTKTFFRTFHLEFSMGAAISSSFDCFPILTRILKIHFFFFYFFDES